MNMTTLNYMAPCFHFIFVFYFLCHIYELYSAQAEWFHPQSFHLLHFCHKFSSLNHILNEIPVVELLTTGQGGEVVLSAISSSGSIRSKFLADAPWSK